MGIPFVENFFNYFGTTTGVLIILGIGILIFLIVAIIVEKKTKKLFPSNNNEEFIDEDE